MYKTSSLSSYNHTVSWIHNLRIDELAFASIFFVPPPRSTVPIFSTVAHASFAKRTHVFYEGLHISKAGTMLNKLPRNPSPFNTYHVLMMLLLCDNDAMVIT